MFKFQRKLHLARPLAGLLIERMGQQPEGSEILVPVPLHPQRLRQRGFNQSVELTRILAKHYGLPYDLQLCRRIKATKAQSELNKQERCKNLANAFEVSAAVRETHLVLVDDVITTGATVTELSKALKKAGARRIDVWAIARTQTL
jgi:ComF family protein